MSKALLVLAFALHSQVGVAEQALMIAPDPTAYCGGTPLDPGTLARITDAPTDGYWWLPKESIEVPSQAGAAAPIAPPGVRGVGGETDYAGVFEERQHWVIAVGDREVGTTYQLVFEDFPVEGLVLRVVDEPAVAFVDFDAAWDGSFGTPVSCDVMCVDETTRLPTAPRLQITYEGPRAVLRAWLVSEGTANLGLPTPVDGILLEGDGITINVEVGPHAANGLAYDVALELLDAHTRELLADERVVIGVLEGEEWVTPEGDPEPTECSDFRGGCGPSACCCDGIRTPALTMAVWLPLWGLLAYRRRRRQP
jgi:hypothetical protein